MSYWEKEAAGVAKEQAAPAYDTHCPLMGQRRLNYYRSSCAARQRDPKHSRYCYPKCKLK